MVTPTFIIRVFGLKRQLINDIILQAIGKEEERVGYGFPVIGVRVNNNYLHSNFNF